MIFKAKAITIEELRSLGQRIDSEYVIAESMEAMYRKLNEGYSAEEWTLLRSPAWCGNRIVALVVRPRAGLV